jgi:DNA-directed RNA polymerase subunit beta
VTGGATPVPTATSFPTGNGKVPGVSFSKLPSTMTMPNMLDVQVRAFRSLLQTDAAAAEREDVGLERVFNEVFPITDVNNKFSLEFVSYSLGEPKYSVEECIERDMTFAAPLKATLRLVVWEERSRTRSGGRRTSSRRRSISVISRC